MSKTKKSSRTKAHTVYKTSEGKRVPGVTTITGQLEKPALINWAWKLGMAGEDYKLVRDKAGSSGTLFHYLGNTVLAGKQPDHDYLNQFAPDVLEEAMNCLLSMRKFCNGRAIEPVLMEVPLVSDEYEYGGTFDFFGFIDGNLVVLDFKTGGIYKEHIYQISAYRRIIIDEISVNPGMLPPDLKDRVISQVDNIGGMILGVTKNNDDSYESRTYSTVQMNAGFLVFESLLGVYYAMKSSVLKGV